MSFNTPPPLKAPWRVTLDTNPDNCNLHCIMCEDHSPFSEPKKARKNNGTLRPIMQKNLLEKIIREAASAGTREIIPSTMGEPLLYPHFDHIVNLCRELGLTINLTTNGTFPSPNKYKNVEYWAKKILPIGSDVKISWNGASAKTHEKIMLGSNFEQHIDYAKRFIKTRNNIALETGHYCNVTMQLTFLEDNISELTSMVSLAIELGFDRIKGHHLWAHFKEIKNQSMRRNANAIKRWNEEVKKAKKLVANHTWVNRKIIKLENIFELDINQKNDIAPDGKCPFLGKEVWVNSLGQLNVCCAPDKERLSLGEFGNLNNQSLMEIWQGDNYQHLQQHYLTNSLCKCCNMRKPVNEI